MKTVDTCTFCAKKKLCMPTKPYYGWCQWRETEQTANMEQSNDTSNNDGCVGESRSGTR